MYIGTTKKYRLAALVHKVCMEESEEKEEYSLIN